MKLIFVTTNSKKFEEAKAILNPFGVELEQINYDYPENHDESIEEIAKSAARELAIKFNQSVIVEDAGLFFDAYPKFPGALPKFAFKTLGFKGLLKLLENEPRGACFKAALGYCEPGHEPILLEGFMHGRISNHVHGEKENDPMPYDKIFIPKGEERAICEMSVSEKNKISHRHDALTKLGEYLKEKNKNN